MLEAAGAGATPEQVHLVTVLEALGALEARGQAPASSRLVRALCRPPLPSRACPVLGLARHLGLVELVAGELWRLTQEGLALVREPTP